MIEYSERVLVATYFTTRLPPAVGTVLDIQLFKEEEAYPDQVRVLSRAETSSDEHSIGDEAKIFDVIVEPV